MRTWLLAGILVAGLARPAYAGEDENRLIGNLLTGLTGTQQTSDAASSAAARHQLAQTLIGGEYVTSRQGEPIDMIVAGVALTHKDHVYVAKPVSPALSSPPSSTPSR